MVLISGIRSSTTAPYNSHCSLCTSWLPSYLPVLKSITLAVSVPSICTNASTLALPHVVSPNHGAGFQSLSKAQSPSQVT